jgi:hypothetical protein
VFGASSRRNLSPLQGRVDLWDRETEIVSGIQAIDAAGHTAGHLALAIRSGGHELLYISDAALHPIHLEHPDWHPVWDFEPSQAIATKRRLFDRGRRSTNRSCLHSTFLLSPASATSRSRVEDGGGNHSQEANRRGRRPVARGSTLMPRLAGRSSS